MKAVLIAVAIVVVVNAITFFAFGIDKWKAKHDRWRIPESALLLLAFLGGSIGAYAGMKAFHHKTQHKKFTIFVPLFIALHIGLALYVLYLILT